MDFLARNALLDFLGAFTWIGFIVLAMYLGLTILNLWKKWKKEDEDIDKENEKRKVDIKDDGQPLDMMDKLPISDKILRDKWKIIRIIGYIILFFVFIHVVRFGAVRLTVTEPENTKAEDIFYERLSSDPLEVTAIPRDVDPKIAAAENRLEASKTEAAETVDEYLEEIDEQDIRDASARYLQNEFFERQGELQSRIDGINSQLIEDDTLSDEDRVVLEAALLTLQDELDNLSIDSIAEELEAEVETPVNETQPR